MRNNRTIPLCLCALAVGSGAAAGSRSASRDLGLFTHDSDVGTVAQPGGTRFDRATGTYRVVGNGDDLWAAKDDFHFANRAEQADASIAATIGPVDGSGEPHSKAGLMVRQDLAPDSPYADAVIHENGLVALQYREARGGVTHEIQLPERGPRRLELERRGDYVVMSVADTNGRLHAGTGFVRVKLATPYRIGLLVCSHSDTHTKTVAFTDVRISRP